jgi:hypothetical protein
MRNIVRELKLWLFAIALVALGLAIKWVKPDWHAPSDALIIAGVLAVTVDRYVKLRLRDDIASDVFFAALGIHLPEELKDEILAIGNCKLVRRNMVVRYKLTPHTDQNFICCETETEFQMENLTAHPHEFDQNVWVSRSPAGVNDPQFPILFIKAQLAGDGYEHMAREIELEERDHDRGWHRSIRIPPKATAHFWSTTQQILPSRYEEPFLLLQPTVGITVRVDCPPDMNPSVTFDHRLRMEADKLPRNTWKFCAAFLPHSSFRVSWGVAAATARSIDIGPHLHVKNNPPAPTVVVRRDVG